MMACLALLAACAAGEQTRFAGTLAPQAGTCDPPSAAILTLRRTAVDFVPASGTLVLKGRQTPDGQIAATLTLPGADRKPYTIALAAQRRGPTITGAYTTPRCRYRLTLHQTDD